MELLRFSFRNLTRQRRRTIINLLTIGFAVGILIIMDMLVAGPNTEMVNNIIWMGLGHLKIEKKGYDEESLRLPLDILIDNYESVIEKVEGLKDVDGVSARLISGGILSFGTKRSPVLIEGIDPEKEKDISVFSPQSVSGEYIKEGEYGILVGKELADLMGIEPGATIFLYARTKDEANNLIDLEVKGIFSVGYAPIEKRAVFIPIDILQSFLDTDDVSEIVLMLNDIEKTEEIKVEMEEILSEDEVEIFSWKHFASEIELIIEMRTGFLQIFRFVLLIIALAGIINTMFMNVWERKKEIGTLRAIGYSRGDITVLFLIESFWTGLLGALIGWALAFILGIFLVRYGIPIPQEALAGVNIPMEETVRGEMHFTQFITAFFLGLIASIIAGLAPALRASRIKIIDALREY